MIQAMLWQERRTKIGPLPTVLPNTLKGRKEAGVGGGDVVLFERGLTEFTALVV